MEFDIVYPKPAKHSRFMAQLRLVCGWVFLAAAVACFTVNLCVGGKWWSIVVIWAMVMVWTLVLKRPLVERNLIGQGVRLFVATFILLLLVDLLLAPGWAHIVLPLFTFGCLLTLWTLFFVNVTRRRHNVMSLIAVTVAALIGSAVSVGVAPFTRWPAIVLCAAAGALFIAGVAILRFHLLRELRRRFHVR